MNKVRHLRVLKDDDGQRLDRWLKKHVPEIPYGLAQKIIRKGQIRVDGKRAKPDMRLCEGQDIRIPPVKDKPKPQKAVLSSQDAEFIRSLVIYDDGDVLAINKPQGLAVQGGTKTARHVDGMLEALKDKEGVKPRLVHRLDKDTSGILLLARSAQVAKVLGQEFKKRDIKKIYWAIVTPTPEMHEGTIKAPLLKGGGPQKEKMLVNDKDGKVAITDYTVLDHAAESAAFVAFWPRTGRTHQIRAHAALMDCPVLGDGKYGGKQAAIEGLEHSKKMHLHAQRIICAHPVKKTMIDIQAPLPDELAKTWKLLGFELNPKVDPFADIR